MKITLAGKSYKTGPAARVVVAPDTHWTDEYDAMRRDLEAYAKARGLKVTQPFVGHGDYFEMVPATGGECNCEFEGEPGDEPEDSWHYRRECEACRQFWYSLHCEHDGVQRPCLHCGHVHAPKKA